MAAAVSYLSIQNLLLLINLLYLSSGSESSQRADKICGISINSDQLYNAVQNSPELLKLQFITATTEVESGAVCAAFYYPEAQEVIVVFRGTSKGEWLDNFEGGAATDRWDRVSTRQQIYALEWYQSLDCRGAYVTVAGHSKGGNKAKYIAVLDDSVNRCVSFNGQGFSDEFMNWYYPRIVLRQSVIENHNIDYDYVNLLLNDFGSTTYYKNQLAAGSFLSNHCPDAYLRYLENGQCTMERTFRERPKLMEELDRFLNHCLRSMQPRARIDFVRCIGVQVQAQADGVPWNYRLEYFLEDQNLDVIAWLIAFAMWYENRNLQFQTVVKQGVKLLEIEELDRLLCSARAIVEWKYFELFCDVKGFLGKIIPEWGLIILEQFLEEKYHVKLERRWLYRLVILACKVSELEKSDIFVELDGGDIPVLPGQG